MLSKNALSMFLLILLVLHSKLHAVTNYDCIDKCNSVELCNAQSCTHEVIQTSDNDSKENDEICNEKPSIDVRLSCGCTVALPNIGYEIIKQCTSNNAKHLLHISDPLFTLPKGVSEEKIKLSKCDLVNLYRIYVELKHAEQIEHFYETQTIKIVAHCGCEFQVILDHNAHPIIKSYCKDSQDCFVSDYCGCTWYRDDCSCVDSCDICYQLLKSFKGIPSINVELSCGCTIAIPSAGYEIIKLCNNNDPKHLLRISDPLFTPQIKSEGTPEEKIEQSKCNIVNLYRKHIELKHVNNIQSTKLVVNCGCEFQVTFDHSAYPKIKIPCTNSQDHFAVNCGCKWSINNYSCVNPCDICYQLLKNFASKGKEEYDKERGPIVSDCGCEWDGDWAPCDACFEFIQNSGLG